MPIVTQRNRIPWTWAFFIGLPWVAAVYADQISQQPLAFTLRRFVTEPRTITLILSVNILFNFLVGVCSNYLSDRIWTRWGRRRPFLIVGAIGAATTIALVPLAPSLPLLVVCIVAFQFFVDLGRPWEALFNEVIPAQQRGRAGTFRMLLQNLGGLFFGSVLIGQYDNRYALDGGWTITGEHVIYWVTALVLLASAAFFILCIRETPPNPPPVRAARGPILTELRTAALDIFGTRQAWGVYLLYLCPIVAGAGGGAMGTFFLTEQLGRSKADLGVINAWVLPFMLVVCTPIAGFLADRLDRIRMMQVGILMPAAVQLALVLYTRWYTGFEASVPVLIAFGMVNNFFLAWLWAVWGPVLFDYIPAERMGTFMAGFTVTSGLVGFLLTNAGGAWVEGWTAYFGNPGRADFDYSSIHFLGMIFACAGLVGTIAFSRLVRRGLVSPVGIVERVDPVPPPTAGS